MMSEAISTGRAAPVLAIPFNIAPTTGGSTAVATPASAPRSRRSPSFAASTSVAVSPTLFSGALSSSRVKKSCRPSVSSVDTTKSTTAAPPTCWALRSSFCLRDSAEVPVRARVRRSNLPSLVPLDTAPAPLTPGTTNCVTTEAISPAVPSACIPVSLRAVSNASFIISVIGNG